MELLLISIPVVLFIYMFYAEGVKRVMSANPGSYIIKGNEGEFWAVKQSIFEKTYMEVTEEHGIQYND